MSVRNVGNYSITAQKKVLFGKVTLLIFGIWSPQGMSFARKQTRNLGFVMDIGMLSLYLKKGLRDFVSHL